MVQERATGHALIWWGMLTAPFIYAGVLLLRPFAVPPAQDLLMPTVFLALGVAQALAGQVLWVLHRRGGLPRHITTAAPRTVPIIVWSLDESAAVMGLVIAFIGAPVAWSVALFGVAVAALLLNPYWTLEGAA